MFRTNQKCFFLNFLLVGFFNAQVAKTTMQCCPQTTYLIGNSHLCSGNQTINLQCKHGAFILDPNSDENDKFSLNSNGSLLVLGYDKPYDDGFCIGKIRRNETVVSENLVALVCFESEFGSQDLDFIAIVLRVLMLISILFLLLTLYIYIILPNLRDIQGKCVIAFICSLTASYITLFIVQTFTNISQDACVMEAAALYFFMSASFFWNNIITFNIWKTIRSSFFNIKDKLWPIIYVSWGFGMPFVMVLLSFILEHVPVGSHVRPHFAETKCWFRGKKESWTYFYGPISVLLILNVLMFLQSSWIIWRNYRNSVPSRIRSLRFKCVMYLRLFLLMGITWLFEIISFATNDHPNTKYIWFITDCLNSAQGFIIFLILIVYRQKVRLGLLNKKLFNIKWPKSWAEEKIQESSLMSVTEEVELAHQKIKMIDES